MYGWGTVGWVVPHGPGRCLLCIASSYSPFFRSFSFPSFPCFGPFTLSPLSSPSAWRIRELIMFYPSPDIRAPPPRTPPRVPPSSCDPTSPHSFPLPIPLPTSSSSPFPLLLPLSLTTSRWPIPSSIPLAPRLSRRAGHLHPSWRSGQWRVSRSRRVQRSTRWIWWTTWAIQVA